MARCRLTLEDMLPDVQIHLKSYLADNIISTSRISRGNVDFIRWTGACSTYGGVERRIQGFGGKT